MVSLIYWFINPFLKIIKVRRMPPAKAINANLLGLSLGLFLVLAATSFQYSAIFATQPWFNSLILLALVVASSYFLGGFFTIIVAVSAFFLSRLSPTPGTLLYSLEQLTLWNIIGYGFGAIFATLYNDFVFLYLVLFEKDRIKWYAYFRDKKREKEFNIIKSPIESEEAAVQVVLSEETDPEKRKKLEERKLYDFEIGEPQQPYTILFVANPYIRKRRTEASEPDRYELDPIIDDPELFYHSVDRALRSFESNEVLGNPEIWSRLRVISIFDSELKTRSADEVALLEEFQDTVRIDGETPLNLIDPLPDMKTKVEDMLDANQDGEDKLGISTGDIDVIFAMSASPTHDRSTAHFSDYVEREDEPQPEANDGKNFTFNIDPHGTKEDEINPGSNLAMSGRKHEYHITEPGRVALNVIGAIQRTFIHEFAHAMSSMINGAITDEYADVFEVDSEQTNTNPPFYINRIERIGQSNGKFTPVHKVFADYNCVVFHSDLEHPSAKENWLGYFPDRDETGVSCIMDRFTGYYHFDELISNFMYDRLSVKVQREKKP